MLVSRLERLIEDYRTRAWLGDFLAFAAKENLFATFLTPSSVAGEGEPDKRWDTARIAALNEILGFYGLDHWYASHVHHFRMFAGDGSCRDTVGRRRSGGHVVGHYGSRAGCAWGLHAMTLKPDSTGGRTRCGSFASGHRCGPVAPDGQEVLAPFLRSATEVGVRAVTGVRDQHRGP